MSKPFDADRDEAWAEDELRRACAELDGHIPADYFETFSSRLAAKLETESMETTETNDLSGSESLPPSADTDDRDEHSGLHEIKALASSARAKITRRRTTESDIEDSLLASSSAGLPAVVLPDPDKSTPGIAVLSSSTPELDIGATAAPGSSFGAGVAGRSAPKPWLWVAIAGSALAAAAAVLLVIQSNNKDAKSADDAKAGEKPAAVTASAQSAPAKKAAKTSAPVVAPLGGASADESAPGAGAAMAIAAPPTDAKEESAEEGRGQAESLDRRAKAKLEAKREREAKNDASKAEDKNKAEKKKKDADKTETGKTKPDDSEKEGKKTGGGAGDIDSILDEVTGGPSPDIQDDEQEKKPDKKRIGSSDVKKAMGGIRGRVNRCGEKAEFTGRVSMRFSVAPSGKVTKAKAKTSNAKVARCVEAAVKRARFPTFEPPSMSFSYPFLITD